MRLLNLALKIYIHKRIMTLDVNRIQKNFEKLKQEVEKFSKDVKIVVVTKYIKDIEVIKKLAEIGVTDIAENYAQDLVYKYHYLEKDGVNKNFNWHFIGHLQKNKVKKVVPICELIQSVDSIELAKKIDFEAKKINKSQNCLIELKVSEEETKFGIPKEEIFKFVEELNSLNLTNIKLVGLMTMAPYFDDPAKTRPYFKQAYEVFKFLQQKITGFNILSMGMSNDYKIALEEGSNMLRIGSLLFS